MKLGLVRNYVYTGAPCAHCGHGWALWLCPSGLPCTICSDCAGVLVHRHREDLVPQGWPRLLP